MIWNVSTGMTAKRRFASGAGYVFGIALLGLLVGTPALSMAQSNAEVRALVDRINRLEKDLTDIQRQMYGGSGAPASRPQPPSSSSAPTGAVGGISSEGLNLLMQRISALEEEQRRMTGEQEEMGFKIDRLSSRLDKLVQDVEYRLTELERRQSDGAGTVPLGGDAAGAGGESSGTTIIGGGSQPSSEPRALGTLSADSAAGSAETGSATASGGGQLPAGSMMEQYNHAISLIRDERYADAEVAFKQFLQNHKDSELAGNAQYWLGETYYVRGDYPNAASTFFEGYQSYPDSSKAADNLLKLGMSLGRMDQKAEACATFGQLAKQFPQLPTRLAQTAEREKQKYGCS